LKSADWDAAVICGCWQGDGRDAAARKCIKQEEVDRVLGEVPPAPRPDDKELESAYWFHRGFVAASLRGEGTAPTPQLASVQSAT